MNRFPIVASLAVSLLSLAVAAVVYFGSRYTPSVLVVYARTAAEAPVKVYWDSGSGYSENAAKYFTLTNSRDGFLRGYTVHLPATGVKSLKIVPPVQSFEDFEILQMGLVSDSVQYTWNNGGKCVQQLVGSGRFNTGPCFDDSPQIAFTAPPAVVISGIADSVLETSSPERITLTAVSLLFSILGISWLLRAAGSGDMQTDLRCCGARAAWLVLVACYLFQLHMICKYAVDVPYLDEWYYFAGDALTGNSPWSWLFAFHNEHRIVLTKLMAWMNLQLFGLDFIKQQLFNYGIYGGILIALVRLKIKVLGEAFNLFPLFLVFTLSPVNFHNHLCAFQSQFHLVTFFSILALLYAYEQRAALRNCCLFAFFTLLAAYSFSAGVVVAIVYLLCHAAFMALSVAAKRVTVSQGLARTLVVAGIIGTGLACWFFGYENHPQYTSLALPFSTTFWSYFLNVLSFAFGFSREAELPGVLCLAVVVVPVVVLLLKRETRSLSQVWKIFAGIAGILAILALISMGRADMGLSKSSRYTEFGLMLIPFAAIAWYFVIRNPLWRNSFLLFFWLFCFMFSLPNWTGAFYREYRMSKLSSLECIEMYYNGTGDGNCEPLLQRPINEYLDNARKTGIRFTRQFARPL